MDGKLIRNERSGEANHITFEVFSKKMQNMVPLGQKFKITEAEKRTLRQNAYMWALIAEIAKAEDGHRGNDNEVYIRLLEMAGAKVDYFAGVPEAYLEIKKTYKIVHIVDYMTSPKGVELAVYKCYYGSSRFKPKEMADFLDVLIDYCEKLEIPVDRNRLIKETLPEEKGQEND